MIYFDEGEWVAQTDNYNWNLTKFNYFWIYNEITNERYIPYQLFNYFFY
jgi:hypothetical protein